MASDLPPLIVQLVDAPTLLQHRRVMEAILLCARAARYRREVAPAMKARVRRLQPSVYQWHWLAWRMRGFQRGSQLGYTDDGRVYVFREGAAWLGDPKTDTIWQIDPQTAPIDVSVPGPAVQPLPDLATLPCVNDRIH